ncbi:hypothetical protein DM813_04635 [Pseudomonas alkylphenolica]|uniref:Aromatic hydrocarbon degradation protein n=1 Tax=Pseudomonas alkylphenolica TaxID=237609 RepID=A0A443ZVV3_9PSED|nr:outer membrane protein transport protein [Pseudomonas alkylphenolica]RWU25026.1 hypothetical protein DM813_04635 [Pseudomonas alkylphenolica]
MNTKLIRALSIAPVILLSSQLSQANVGTHLVGYGAKAQSMGGASVAFPQDAIAAANNPAGMALVGNRFDADVQMLYATSETEFGSSANKHNSSIFMAIPEFGVNFQITPKVTLGVSTYASGVGFKYDDPLVPVPGFRRARGTLKQFEVLPTATYTFDNGLSLGLSFVYAIQQFEAQGLPGPFPGGQNPYHGKENSYGTSWRIGGLWKINDQWAVGASYNPKIKMSKLSGYKDDLLSQSGGSADSPEQYSIGASYKPTDRWTMALDLQYIGWDKTDAFSEGFGWRSQTVVKAGAAYELNKDWTVRGGVSHARLHTTEDYTAQNSILGGLNTTALTTGVTRKLTEDSELNLTFEYDFGPTLNGTGPSEGFKTESDFYTVTVGYGWKF